MTNFSIYIEVAKTQFAVAEISTFNEFEIYQRAKCYPQFHEPKEILSKRKGILYTNKEA